MPIATEARKSKVCKTCEEEKPLSEFSGCGVTPDRLQPNCKPCHEERKRAGLSAANARRAAQKATSATVAVAAQPEARSADGPPTESAPKSPLPIPYPGFEEFSRGRHDRRAFAKTTANFATQILNERPDHPNRDKIMEMIEEDKRIADMDDDEFRLNELYEANPLHKLSHDEKLHCIRTLPLPIVQKLFPHL